MEAAAIPGLAIPLLQCDCADTSVDLDWVWDAIHLTSADQTRRLDLTALQHEVETWFTPAALEEVARFAFRVNEGTENIGARRLHTIMERVLDEISFEAPEKKGQQFVVDAAYVQKMLSEIVKDQDLSRYIL